MAKAVLKNRAGRQSGIGAKTEKLNNEIGQTSNRNYISDL